MQQTNFCSLPAHGMCQLTALTDVWGFHSLSESENLGKWIATASAPNLERIVLLLLLRKTGKP